MTRCQPPLAARRTGRPAVSYRRDEPEHVARRHAAAQFSSWRRGSSPERSRGYLGGAEPASSYRIGWRGRSKREVLRDARARLTARVSAETEEDVDVTGKVGDANAGLGAIEDEPLAASRCGPCRTLGRVQSYAGSSVDPAASRSRATACRSNREMCICETPTRSPISDCVRSSAKRSLRISRSRSLRTDIMRLNGGGVLGLPVARFVVAQRVDELGSVLVVVGAGAIERVGPVGGCGLVRFEHLLDADPHVVRDLGRSRRAPELVNEAIGRAADARRQLLQVARNPHRPALVAEIALQLSRDRRHSERRERVTACGVEPVDGLQQAHGRDLNEVLQRLAATVVTPRQPRGQWEKPLHQRVAGRLIVAPAITSEQPALLDGARQPVVAGAVAPVVVHCAASRPNVRARGDGDRSARPWRAQNHRRWVRGLVMRLDASLEFRSDAA